MGLVLVIIAVLEVGPLLIVEHCIFNVFLSWFKPALATCGSFATVYFLYYLFFTNIFNAIKVTQKCESQALKFVSVIT